MGVGKVVKNRYVVLVAVLLVVLLAGLVFTGIKVTGRGPTPTCAEIGFSCRSSCGLGYLAKSTYICLGEGTCCAPSACVSAGYECASSCVGGDDVTTDYGCAVPTARCCNYAEPVVKCGNGVLDENEQCDDGNLWEDDGCYANCTYYESIAADASCPGEVVNGAELETNPALCRGMVTVHSKVGYEENKKDIQDGDVCCVVTCRGINDWTKAEYPAAPGTACAVLEWGGSEFEPVAQCPEGYIVGAGRQAFLCMQDVNADLPTMCCQEDPCATAYVGGFTPAGGACVEGETVLTALDTDGDTIADWTCCKSAISEDGDDGGIDLGKGLVMYLPFEEKERMRAIDFSEAGNDGWLGYVPNEAPTRVGGVNGSALRFDGVDDYVWVADNASLDMTNAVSVAAWVNILTDAPSDADYGEYLVGKWEFKDNMWPMGNTYAGYKLYYNYNTNRLVWSIGDGTDVTRFVRSNDSLVPGRWYFVAGTFSGNWLKLYVNGVEVASEIYAGSIAPNAQSLTIGKGLSWASRYEFNGSIDEVMVYNRSLTPTEIGVLYSVECLVDEHCVGGIVCDAGVCGGAAVVTDEFGIKPISRAAINLSETLVVQLELVNATANVTYVYGDNTSLFNVSDTGLINYTPVAADVGNYSIEINVSDGEIVKATDFMLRVVNVTAGDVTGDGGGNKTATNKTATNKTATNKTATNKTATKTAIKKVGTGDGVAPKITGTPPEPYAEPSGGFFLRYWMWIAIVGGLVVLGGGGTVLALALRKKPEVVTPTAATPSGLPAPAATVAVPTTLETAPAPVVAPAATPTELPPSSPPLPALPLPTLGESEKELEEPVEEDLEKEEELEEPIVGEEKLEEEKLEEEDEVAAAKPSVEDELEKLAREEAPLAPAKRAPAVEGEVEKKEELKGAEKKPAAPKAKLSMDDKLDALLSE